MIPSFPPPNATSVVPSSRLDPFAEVATSFAMLPSGPALPPEEVELQHVQAVEVIVLWGTNVLHVAHLNPPRNFAVGEEKTKYSSCDLFIPSEKLGTTRLPLVLGEGGTVSVVIPEPVRGHHQRLGGERVPLEGITGSCEPWPELAGARRLPLSKGDRVEFEKGGFVFRIASVAAGKPSRRGLGAAWDRTIGAYFGLSFVTHASLVAILAYFIPPLNLSDDEELDRERRYSMSAFLEAAAERERKNQPDLASRSETSEASGTGKRATGEEGSMGTPHVSARNKRYAVKGPKENPDPHLAREASLREAMEFGMIGLLNNAAGDPNAPTAPFGRDQSLGTDDLSARGSMWGDDIGDAFGAGGLGLASLSEGGGGRAFGVGLGQLGTLGRGALAGNDQGFGPGGGLRGTHVARGLRVRPGVTSVSGHLPPEVIQRIVRQNFGRFRMCYQQALGKNPSLEGRVAARFIIGRDGSVSNVSNGGSDLPDSAVVSCVLAAFYGLSFPEPQNGIVRVVYPIAFSPG